MFSERRIKIRLSAKFSTVFIEEDEAFIVVDWAMKFTAMRFREKQTEWFAKRGINWHVSSFIMRRDESLEV